MSNDVDDYEISDDYEITDEELTALALAAEPGSPFAEDAVPWRSVNIDGEPLLPDWYMPIAASSARHDWRAIVAVALAVGLVLCNAFAICVTYGFPEIP
jgi:hypothetical protein